MGLNEDVSEIRQKLITLQEQKTLNEKEFLEGYKIYNAFKLEEARIEKLIVKYNKRMGDYKDLLDSILL